MCIFQHCNLPPGDFADDLRASMVKRGSQFIARKPAKASPKTVLFWPFLAVIVGPRCLPVRRSLSDSEGGSFRYHAASSVGMTPRAVRGFPPPAASNHRHAVVGRKLSRTKRATDLPVAQPSRGAPNPAAHHSRLFNSNARATIRSPISPPSKYFLYAVGSINLISVTPPAGSATNGPNGSTVQAYRNW
jgi:hypothetical protein